MSQKKKEKDYTLYGKIQNYTRGELLTDYELMVKDEWYQ